jgi:hypothetical protein
MSSPPRSGYKVIEAVDGAGGVAKAASDRPDFVLMDSSCPCSTVTAKNLARPLCHPMGQAAPHAQLMLRIFAWRLPRMCVRFGPLHVFVALAGQPSPFANGTDCASNRDVGTGSGSDMAQVAARPLAGP